jgi:tetratricopeptide (TPR) repeat protein
MKKLLKLSGIIALVILAVSVSAFFYLKHKGKQLDAESKQFAEETVRAVCTDWSWQVLFDRASPALVASAPVERQQAVCAYLLNTLGRMKEFNGLSGEAVMRFQKGPGVTASYDGKAVFENDSAVITVGLVYADDKWQLVSFDVKPLKSVSAGAVPKGELVSRAKALIDGFTGDMTALNTAYAYLDEAIKGQPDNAEAYAQLARVVYKAGYISGYNYRPEALQRAQDIIEVALKKEPNNYSAHVVQGYIYLFGKNLGGARGECEKAVGLDAGPTDTDFLRAEIAYAEKDYASAAKGYKSALLKSKDSVAKAKAYDALAAVYKAQKMYALSEAAFLEELKLTPDSPWALINYSSMLIRRGGQQDYDKAIKYSAKALAKMDFGMGHYMLSQANFRKGLSLWKKGQNLPAGKYFEQAVIHDPASVDAYYYMGLYFREAAKKSKNTAALEKSTAAFKKALELNPAYNWAKKELAVNEILAQAYR